jgi:hypothetical protein
MDTDIRKGAFKINTLRGERARAAWHPDCFSCSQELQHADAHSRNTFVARCSGPRCRRTARDLDTIVSAALGEYLNSQRHRMYQISTSAALVEGADTGAVCSRALLEHGDFGLGTFENLDGELVVFEGAIYQVRGD